MIWKTLAAEDFPAAAELSRLARWNQTERDWQGYLEFAPEGCQGAIIDGRLAGTFTTVGFGDAVGWIGMVLVHPDFRRQGLGTALLERAIELLRKRGVTSIGLDATEMGRAVYLPLGFQDEYRVDRLEGKLSEEETRGFRAGTTGSARPDAASAADSGLAPAKSREAPPPSSESPLQASLRRTPRRFADVPFALLAELDRQAFGAGRGEVLRSLGSRDPQLCFADPQGAGYLIAREGREAIQIGPWVARDPATAARLFDSLAAAAPGRRAFLDVPAPNLAGAAWLRERAFTLQRSFTRMTLGGRLPPGRNGWIFGTAGAEKG